MLSDDGDAERLIAAVAKSDAVGSITAIAPASKDDGHSDSAGQRRLVNELDIDPRFSSQVDALIGDVFIVDTFSDALSCARDSQGVTARFASLDGCIASTDGKLSFVRFTEADKQNNALARRRALAQVIKEEERCRAHYELRSLKMAGLNLSFVRRKLHR